MNETTTNSLRHQQITEILLKQEPMTGSQAPVYLSVPAQAIPSMMASFEKWIKEQT